MPRVIDRLGVGRLTTHPIAVTICLLAVKTSGFALVAFDLTVPAGHTSCPFALETTRGLAALLSRLKQRRVGTC